MGLLDNNITFSYLEGKVPLEDLFEVIKQKLGDKYKGVHQERQCSLSGIGNFFFSGSYLCGKECLPSYFYHCKVCSYD